MEALIIFTIIIGMAAIIGYGCSFIPWRWVRIITVLILAAIPGIIFCEVFRSRRLKKAAKKLT